MTSISAALHDLLDPEVPLLTAVDRHFRPDYRQRTDGVWADRVGFVEHIAHLRNVVAAVRVDVLEELEAGSVYAERHVIQLTKDDGMEVVQEVYVFGDRHDDGRFSRVEETTLMLAGAETDRGIGRASST